MCRARKDIFLKAMNSGYSSDRRSSDSSQSKSNDLKYGDASYRNPPRPEKLPLPPRDWILSCKSSAPTDLDKASEQLRNLLRIRA